MIRNPPPPLTVIPQLSPTSSPESKNYTGKIFSVHLILFGIIPKSFYFWGGGRKYVGWVFNHPLQTNIQHRLLVGLSQNCSLEDGVKTVWSLRSGHHQLDQNLLGGSSPLRFFPVCHRLFVSGARSISLLPLTTIDWLPPPPHWWWHLSVEMERVCKSFFSSSSSSFPLSSNRVSRVFRGTRGRGN